MVYLVKLNQVNHYHHYHYHHHHYNHIIITIIIIIIIIIINILLIIICSIGQLLAIMGPTGCGKTSLTNILAARCPYVMPAGAKLTGSITINGEARNEDTFRRISAYVLQDDNLFAHLTVLETLTLGSHFYLPSSTSDEIKANLVDAVISELGLVKARDTIVGDEKIRGVSGGERKRCSIAQQLLTDPAVLFLDEPTSGFGTLVYS